MVIPARNAAQTIDRPLSSLRRQTRGDWRAIVVDDSSDDATTTVVAREQRDDPRITLTSGRFGGAAAARNRGLEEVREPFVLFLDADDAFADNHLERMVGALESAAAAGASYCGYRLVSPSGATVSSHEALPADVDMFAIHAERCGLAIHSCVVRTECVRQIGGFDETLATCEDWDLWQRLARTGMVWERVDGTWAEYVQRTGSLSHDGHALLRDSHRVVRNARARDPRVPIHLDQYLDGLDPAGLDESLIDLLVWSAATELGGGRPAADLVREAERFPVAMLDADRLARILLHRIAEVSGRPQADILVERATDVRECLDALNDVVPGVPTGDLVEASIAGALTLSARPASGVLGRHCFRPLSGADALSDVRLPEGCDILVATLCTGKWRDPTWVQIPAQGHVVSGGAIAGALTVAPRGGIRFLGGGRNGWRGARKARARRGGNQLATLMYHRVAPRSSDLLAQFAVEPATFEKHLDALTGSGWTPLGLEDLSAAVRHGSALPRRGVVLTFDDGYEDFAQVAWPALRRRGIPATVFAVSDHVGGRAEWDRRFGPPAALMSWATLRRMVAEGVSVGSHTCSHPFGSALPVDAAVDELARSMTRLRDELDIGVTSIAYPFGDVNPVIRELSRRAGYLTGFSCVRGVAPHGHDPLMLPRINAAAVDDPIAVLDALVAGRPAVRNRNIATADEDNA